MVRANDLPLTFMGDDTMSVISRAISERPDGAQAMRAWPVSGSTVAVRHGKARCLLPCGEELLFKGRSRLTRIVMELRGNTDDGR